MRHWAKISRTLATVALITTTAVVLDQQAALAADPVPPHSTCTQHTVTVTLSASDPTPYTMAGQLCLEPDALRGGRAVMLMISGLTYDRSYYNNPLTPYSYSWVYSATQHGYSTFNIDRMGVGLSSRPPADKLTVYNQAYVTEQIAGRRHPAVPGRHRHRQDGSPRLPGLLGLAASGLPAGGHLSRQLPAPHQQRSRAGTEELSHRIHDDEARHPRHELLSRGGRGQRRDLV
jgi:hypothetical protein